MEERMCREQKLIDACFQLVMTATAREYNKHFQSLSMERKAAWVADQLRELGFDTAPCGASWGVLMSLLKNAMMH